MGEKAASRVRADFPKGPARTQKKQNGRVDSRRHILIRKLPLLFVLLAGTGAFAQKEFEGLDLTDDKKPEEKKPEPAPTPTPAAKPVERKPVTSKEDLPPG